MTTTLLPGFPPEQASAQLDDASVRFLVAAELYPLEALYGAAYVFIDRCYVLLDRADETHFSVVLTNRSADADAAQLRDLVGEFANELLSCAWRHKIAQENRSIIEATTMQAISGAMGPPSLDDLAALDFSEEPFEDPLGIAVSWEDKYTKKDKPGDDKKASK